MTDRRTAMPGPGTFGSEPRTIGAASSDPDKKVWDQYLAAPNDDWTGICCSGGGIRSASFCLGALQVLREEGCLYDAEYLACASGGAYISVAHAVTASETIRRALAEEGNGDPGDEDCLRVEHAYFSRQAPWAPDSPEEQYLRDRVQYIASAGWIWIALNAFFGIARSLLPFSAGIYLAGFVTGLTFTRWLGPMLRSSKEAPFPPPNVLPFFWVALGASVVCVVFLIVRNLGQRRGFSDSVMATLQSLAIAAGGISAFVFAGLVLLPLLLAWLHGGWLNWLGLGKAIASVFTSAVVAGVASFVSKRFAVVAERFVQRLARLAVGVLVSFAAPILVLVPFVGATYWNAMWGFSSTQCGRFVLAAAALAVLVVAYFGFSEIVSTPHMFYRERLSAAFIGYRKHVICKPLDLGLRQPPWEQPIRFSELLRASTPHARMPKLVICSAVNLSADLPAGRAAASFTFECDRSGGPATGYVPTKWLEEKGGTRVLTLPGMMAVSGAAVAPSMGKHTIPPLRFLMAIFDFRLGLWLPNPARRDEGALLPVEVFRGVAPEDSEETPKPEHAWKSPGALYLLREALGRNGLDQRFVYVTDGGHWENLGLVELLRRGCTRIVCVDASGGDVRSMQTLGQAIALAHSDLGVRITIDLQDVTPPENGGPARAGYAVGRVEFPDCSVGTLIYVPAVVSRSVPHDVYAFAKANPRFPNDTTGDQFFNDDRFEAYRALGRHNMHQAASCGALTAQPPRIDADCLEPCGPEEASCGEVPHQGRDASSTLTDDECEERG